MAGAPAMARRLRVLVVDDEPAVRGLTAALLQAEGHAAEVAAGGEEALSVLADGGFDLVITDQAMPGMSGDRLAAAIKAAHPTTPVFMLTGFGDLIQAAGERSGAVDVVLGKPLTLARLREALAALPATQSPDRCGE